MSGSSRSSKPAIHGMTVADESIEEVAVGSEVSWLPVLTCSYGRLDVL